MSIESGALTATETVIQDPRLLPVAYSEQYADFLIISNRPHVLSVALLSAIGRTCFASAKQVSGACLAPFDLIVIVDDGMDQSEVRHLQSQLQQGKAYFTVVVADNEATRQCWLGQVDSALCIESQHQQGNFINRILESIELKGFVCIDYADIYSVFCNMGKGYFFQGIAKGKFRVFNAIDNALGHFASGSDSGSGSGNSGDIKADTALMVLSGGLNITLDEWESALSYLDSKLPEHCCTMGATKLLADGLIDETLMVSIFLNQAR
ncbi:hypothetical protein VHA01S_046_00080 [Vibrio halioticoli NBRC 102217]|uniref:Uncharacterized protein n=1 Tax=Vibrio halioticoli NBRC 102217 TaxID=1219072 RepID=V5F4Z1_9VIBR|nr:hypothetical protein [Vibrio halioticoli]GAD90499.1 hypothetical protein VHA01S_046_00080 [Vibrio halioticoli NBRC 102217]